MVDVRLVQQVEVPEVWPTVSKYIFDAAEISKGRYTDKIIADLVLLNLMQLWVVEEENKILAAFITEIRDYPTNLKVCVFIALGGLEHKKWVKPIVNTLSKWAESVGCSRLELSGRPGWEKILKNWDKIFVTLELPLGEYHG